MVGVESWGRLSRHHHQLISVTKSSNLTDIICNSKPGIAYGMGRSYGDACLNPGGMLWSMRGLDHFIDFNPDTGELTCEAGVLLSDIQRLALPHGWMLAVTPGTQIVTVGGAIANDVHGKNHHMFGTFGHYLRSLNCQRTTGETLTCSPTINNDWLRATIGGLGLTGVITKATIQLRKVPGPWLHTESIPFTNLAEFFNLAHNAENTWEYTVAWFDCLAKQSGRGIFMRANHTTTQPDAIYPTKKKITMPIVAPVSLVNPLTLRGFNALYYYLSKRKTTPEIKHYTSFFYPLDHINYWNRMYGPRGFYQYQCLIPLDNGISAITAMLNKIAQCGMGSFLAVLKTFGSIKSLGMLSFPEPGVTLALDFPNQLGRTEKLFTTLDDIVAEAKGKIYLAKDARMPRKLFIDSYPELLNFTAYRDPGISSGLSRRLMGY